VVLRPSWLDARSSLGRPAVGRSIGHAVGWQEGPSKEARRVRAAATTPCDLSTSRLKPGRDEHVQYTVEHGVAILQVALGRGQTVLPLGRFVPHATSKKSPRTAALRGRERIRRVTFISSIGTGGRPVGNGLSTSHRSSPPCVAIGYNRDHLGRRTFPGRQPVTAARKNDRELSEVLRLVDVRSSHAACSRRASDRRRLRRPLQGESPSCARSAKATT